MHTVYIRCVFTGLDVGPQRDIIGELFLSLRDHGLHACAYYSLYEWFNRIYRGPQPHQYVDEIMFPEMVDLVTTYQPDLIFADGTVQIR